MSPPSLERAADGTSVGVRRRPGTGPLVVFLHGFTGDGTTFERVADVASGDRPQLIVDLVGHGASDAPPFLEPYTMDAVVDQVLSLIGPQTPGDVHLVGYSMGGRVALSMAARAPWYFASVTTLSSTAGIEDPIDRAARHDADLALADRVETIGVHRFIDEWLALDLFAPLLARLSAQQREMTKSQRLAGSAIGYANSLRGTGTGSMPPVWDRLRSLKSPLLALAGRLDSKYCDIAKQLAEVAPHGQVEIFEGVGHALLLENPDEVAHSLATFLEHCEASPTIAWPQ